MDWLKGLKWVQFVGSGLKLDPTPDFVCGIFKNKMTPHSCWKVRRQRATQQERRMKEGRTVGGRNRKRGKFCEGAPANKGARKADERSEGWKECWKKAGTCAKDGFGANEGMEGAPGMFLRGKEERRTEAERKWVEICDGEARAEEETNPDEGDSTHHCLKGREQRVRGRWRNGQADRKLAEEPKLSWQTFLLLLLLRWNTRKVESRQVGKKNKCEWIKRNKNTE